MKLKLLVLSALLGSGHSVTQASDYGCQVLLCMANPAGPMAVDECKPPIRKLYRDLAKGKPFPSCTMAKSEGVAGGDSWAEVGTGYYDQCPAGTKALSNGQYAVGQEATDTVYRGIGQGTDRTGAMRQPKVCVGAQKGRTAVEVTERGRARMVSAKVYDSVVVLDPGTQPNYVDVYVDSTFSHRVRW